MALPYHRKPRGLLWFWAIGLVLAGILFWTMREIPALTELLRPLYWLIAIALAFITLRWFRPRGGERRQPQERRTDERRETPPDGS